MTFFSSVNPSKEQTTCYVCLDTLNEHESSVGHLHRQKIVHLIHRNCFEDLVRISLLIPASRWTKIPCGMCRERFYVPLSLQPALILDPSVSNQNKRWFHALPQSKQLLILRHGLPHAQFLDEYRKDFIEIIEEQEAAWLDKILEWLQTSTDSTHETFTIPYIQETIALGLGRQEDPIESLSIQSIQFMRYLLHLESLPLIQKVFQWKPGDHLLTLDDLTLTDISFFIRTCLLNYLLSPPLSIYTYQSILIKVGPYCSPELKTHLSDLPLFIPCHTEKSLYKLVLDLQLPFTTLTLDTGHLLIPKTFQDIIRASDLSELEKNWWLRLSLSQLSHLCYVGPTIRHLNQNEREWLLALPKKWIFLISDYQVPLALLIAADQGSFFHLPGAEHLHLYKECKCIKAYFCQIAHLPSVMSRLRAWIFCLNNPIFRSYLKARGFSNTPLSIPLLSAFNHLFNEDPKLLLAVIEQGCEQGVYNYSSLKNLLNIFQIKSHDEKNQELHTLAAAGFKLSKDQAYTQTRQYACGFLASYMIVGYHTMYWITDYETDVLTQRITGLLGLFAALAIQYEWRKPFFNTVSPLRETSVGAAKGGALALCLCSQSQAVAVISLIATAAFSLYIYLYQRMKLH